MTRKDNEQGSTLRRANNKAGSDHYKAAVQRQVVALTTENLDVYREEFSMARRTLVTTQVP
jgi:hypothetical protein